MADMALYIPMATELGRGDTDKDQGAIRKFLKFLLALWREDLERRSEDAKMSTDGKVAR